MFKKYRNVVLGLVVVMALAIPGILAESSANFGLTSGSLSDYSSASADYSSETANEDYEMDVPTALADPPIDVTIKGSGAIILNPYQLNVQGLSGTLYASILQNKSSADQKASVIGLPIVIANNSAANVTAAVRCYVKLGSKAFQLSTTDIAKTETAKKAILYLEAHKCDSSGYLLGSDTWSNKYAEKSHVLFSTNKTQAFKDIFTFDRAETNWNGNGKVQKAAFAVFRVSGSCTTKPDTPWSSTDDTIEEAQIVFHFRNVNSDGLTA